MTTPLPKIKYVTNKDLLEEIHRSKLSYCSYIDAIYERYDIIVNDVRLINHDLIDQLRREKIIKSLLGSKKNKSANLTEEELSTIDSMLHTVPVENIVVRVMTYDHIPINPEKVHKAKTVSEKHLRCNFPPFQHYILKDGVPTCVLKSHWKGGLENGSFCRDHGKMTNNLAIMFMKMVDRYGHKGNWRGYCVTQHDQALTTRGWLTMEQITEDDTIMSCDNGQMKWSAIKSIYRGHYRGLMHKITNSVTDMLITPYHKLLTSKGLIPVEYLTNDTKIILMGKPIADQSPLYDDRFVELAGKLIGVGSTRRLKSTVVSEPSNHRANRLRDLLTSYQCQFEETFGSNNRVSFQINHPFPEPLSTIFDHGYIKFSFLNSLTDQQRCLLINTMTDQQQAHSRTSKRYRNSCRHHIDFFQSLCALSGLRTITKQVSDQPSNESAIESSIMPTKANTTKCRSLNFHNDVARSVRRSRSVHEPTVFYDGMVWCPETEYGCFLLRRNGQVYLTGNTYNDEMKGQALLQLSQVGLQFDESRSDVPNPFAYYTQTITNSFMRIFNIEKKNQNIRDDILIMNGSNPSHTRMVDNELAQKLPPKD